MGQGESFLASQQPTTSTMITSEELPVDRSRHPPYGGLREEEGGHGLLTIVECGRRLVLQEGIFSPVSFLLQHRTHQVARDSILIHHIHSPVASPLSHRRHIQVNLFLAYMLPRAFASFRSSFTRGVVTSARPILAVLPFSCQVRHVGGHRRIVTTWRILVVDVVTVTAVGDVTSIITVAAVGDATSFKDGRHRSRLHRCR